ncbi:MAG: hypothetical protein VYE35_04310, partial [Chloroflexota bacterium]|nr:hypothetical protein [Chloroflexota bacterium]
MGPRLRPSEELGEELLPSSWPDRLRASDSLTGALPRICPELLPSEESDLDGLAAGCSERRLLDHLPDGPPDEERPFGLGARCSAPANSPERLPLSELLREAVAAGRAAPLPLLDELFLLRLLCTLPRRVRGLDSRVLWP